MTDINATQAGVQILVSQNPDLRATQAAVQVLVSQNPDIRVSQVGILVLVPGSFAVSARRRSAFF